MKDQEDQYGEDFESQSRKSSARLSYRSNHSDYNNKEEGLFPSLKHSSKNTSSKGKYGKGLIIPIGATSKDMQIGNDKLQEEVRGLISTLEEQVVKMREYKRRQIELAQDKEHINDKDPGLSLNNCNLEIKIYCYI